MPLVGSYSPLKFFNRVSCASFRRQRKSLLLLTNFIRLLPTNTYVMDINVHVSHISGKYIASLVCHDFGSIKEYVRKHISKILSSNIFQEEATKISNFNSYYLEGTSIYIIFDQDFGIGFT